MKIAVTALLSLIAWQQNFQSTFSVVQCVGDDLNAGPINLDTSLATQIKTACPLTVTIGDSERYKAQNTGDTVEVVLNQPTTINTVTGGVLGNTVYVFHKLRFIWDHDYEGRASYAVDGAQYALTIQYIFYNRGYEYFANAYNQYNGVSIIQDQITVEGVIANKNFTRFENILRSLTKAGSSCEVNGSIREVLYSWYDYISLQYPFYYSYKASFYDLDQNTTTKYDATYIAIPKSKTGFISVCQLHIATTIGPLTGNEDDYQRTPMVGGEQTRNVRDQQDFITYQYLQERFTAFTNLRNYAGSPITLIQPAYSPQGKALLQAEGIVENVYYTAL